jgi:hypothetical protein
MHVCMWLFFLLIGDTVFSTWVYTMLEHHGCFRGTCGGVFTSSASIFHMGIRRCLEGGGGRGKVADPEGEAEWGGVLPARASHTHLR